MPRPDVSDERIPQILNAALKVFNRKGLAAARMEDIAREAKLSIGGVYWYYKGKDEVVLAIMDKVIDKDVAVLTSLLSQAGTVRERLTDYVRATAKEGTEYLPLVYELYGEAQRNLKMRKHIQKYLQHYRGALTQIIQQGMDSGEICGGDANAIAITLAAVYEGTLELALLDPTGVDAEQATIQAVGFIFDGISA
jgi:AcrR family transcriptional regulator